MKPMFFGQACVPSIFNQAYVQSQVETNSPHNDLNWILVKMRVCFSQYFHIYKTCYIIRLSKLQYMTFKRTYIFISRFYNTVVS